MARRTSFGYIPRRSSGAIDKNLFAKKVLRDLIGGPIQGSSNPLRRKDVREVLGKAGVLSKLDASVTGPKSKNLHTLTKKEAVEILQATRRAMRENLEAKGYGLHEQGKFLGRKEESIYRKTVEEHYNKEQAKQQTTIEETAEQRRRVRRRNLMKEDLSSPVRRGLTNEPIDRRSALMKRLGLSGDRTTEKGAKNIAAERKPSGGSQPLHAPMPKQHAPEDEDASTPIEPIEEQQESSPTAPPESPQNAAADLDEEADMDDLPSDKEIEKNLPL